MSKQTRPPHNKTVSYTYGSDNQLMTLTDISGRQTKYYYDEAGRPFAIVKGNGLEADILYDEAGRVSTIADVGNPDGSIYDYEYDANGNITKIYGFSGVESFAYDKLNRLTSWTNEAGNTTSYTYDAVGNLTKKGSKLFTYNAANEIKNAGCSYDSNGNLTSDGKFNYAYNSENQLVKATKVSDGSTVATYEYDYRGLRVAKTTSSGTVRYHWDDNNRLVRESDANGATIALYIYDDRDQLIAVEKGGATYYTHTNWRGDILAITDTSGNRVATYKYDPWGTLISKTGTFDIPIRYAGYYFDSETGMYYLKARYYSPELGRFLTKDTFKGFNEDPQSLNLYGYCAENPVTGIDPDGNHTSNIVGNAHTHKWWGYSGWFTKYKTVFYTVSGVRYKDVWGYAYTGWHKNWWEGISWAFTVLAGFAAGLYGSAGAKIVMVGIGNRIQWDGPYMVHKATIIRRYILN